ncbi:protein translocase subunit [Coemansia sp. RSA 2559]|nr:protein translocase subunit [Coemansia sp. RSA 2559]KAJ2846532.1 protein translocase subunit [Coemansia erecta]
MDYSQSSGLSLNIDSENVSPQDIAAFREKVRHDFAMNNAQELIRRVNQTCFKASVTMPGPSLTVAEQDSLSRCIDKYLASWDVVAKTYVTRLQREGSHR